MKHIPKDAYVEPPKKCIHNMRDMKTWLRSEAFYDLMNFINSVSNAIQGKRITDEIHVSPTMDVLLDIFKRLNSILSATPAVPQQQRYGNKAFRSFCGKMHQEIYSLLHRAVPESKSSLTIELGLYLSESFGNAVRIDYGTGHELSFVFLLCALFKAGILKHEDKVACALRLFNAYLRFIRRMQKKYHIEPAGSHGVWSLDDYQFVAFLWGSAQLALESPFSTHEFLDPNLINEFKEDYMFMGCLDFIANIKSGHFAEHSVQLWSITAVPTWAILYGGLRDMFEEEVLTSFAVMQHVHFGKLMAFSSSRADTRLINPRLGIQPRSEYSSEFDSKSTDSDLPPKFTERPTTRQPSARIITTAKTDDVKYGALKKHKIFDDNESEEEASSQSDEKIKPKLIEFTVLEK